MIKPSYWRCEACRAFTRDGKACEHCGARNRSKIIGEL